MKQTKPTKQTPAAQTSSVAQSNHWLFFVVFIAAAAFLIILGLGIRSSAASRQLEYIEAQNLAQDNQDDIAYLALSSVDIKQDVRHYRSFCDAAAFVRYADKIVDSARVDYDDDLKDQDVYVICFRIGFESGHYIYPYYAVGGGQGGSSLHIQEVFQDGKNATTYSNVDGENALIALDVFTGIAYPTLNESLPAPEYVALTERGETCDGEAFDVAGRQTFVLPSGGGRIDLALFGLHFTISPPATPQYPATALCLRSRLDGNYIYEKYRDVNHISFYGGWDDSGIGAADTLLRAFAYGAFALDYAILEIGEECAAGAFSSLASNINPQEATPFDKLTPPLTIDVVTLSANSGFCFRANYGNNNLVYKSYDRFADYVRIKVVWEFEIWAQQYHDSLAVSSSRDIQSWRALSNDYWSDRTVCDLTMFEWSLPEGGVAVADPAALLSGNLSQLEKRGSFAFSLNNEEDAGRLYCIEVTDDDGNKAYIKSNIIQRILPLEISVQAVDGKLVATANDGSKSLKDIRWFIAREDVAGEGCNFNGPSYAFNQVSPGYIEMFLNESGYGKYFCFEATNNLTFASASVGYVAPLNPVTEDSDENNATDPSDEQE